LLARASPVREEAQNNGIFIAAILHVAGGIEAVERLVYAEGPLAVRRVGISDDPVQMRLGSFVPWSEHEDGIRLGIHLHDKRNDSEGRKRGMLFLEEQQVAAHLAYRIELMDALMKLLVERNVLSSTDLEALRARAGEGQSRRRLAFWKVEDVDAIDLM
jgi:hypothetical protein